MTTAIQTATAQMTSDQIRETERASGIPSELWGAFVYLDSKLNYYNISKDFLGAARLSDSINDLIKNIEVSVLNSRDITVAVRDREPRLAEVLANALTASYKYQYDNQIHSAAAAPVKFYSDQQMAAGQRIEAAMRRLVSVREAYDASLVTRPKGNPRLQVGVDLCTKEYNAAYERQQDVAKKLNAARDELAQTYAKGALLVRYWAGAPPGTPEHPESPAREGAVKRNWVWFWSAILLSLVGSSLVVLGTAFVGSQRGEERHPIDRPSGRVSPGGDGDF